MAYLPRDRKALSIRGRQRPAAPIPAQRLMVVEVDERGGSSFQRFFADIPGIAPRQLVRRRLGNAGHAREPDITPLAKECGIEPSLQVLTSGLAPGHMLKTLAKTC